MTDVPTTTDQQPTTPAEAVDRAHFEAMLRSAAERSPGIFDAELRAGLLRFFEHDAAEATKLLVSMASPDAAQVALRSYVTDLAEKMLTKESRPRRRTGATGSIMFATMASGSLSCCP